MGETFGTWVVLLVSAGLIWWAVDTHQDKQKFEADRLFAIELTANEAYAKAEKALKIAEEAEYECRKTSRSC